MRVFCIKKRRIIQTAGKIRHVTGVCMYRLDKREEGRCWSSSGPTIFLWVEWNID